MQWRFWEKILGGWLFFGRQQRLSEITLEPIKNLGAWARFGGGAVPPGPNIEPPLYECMVLRIDGEFRICQGGWAGPRRV